MHKVGELLLPNSMNPALAQALGALLRPEQEEQAKFMSLALLYLSWLFEQEADAPNESVTLLAYSRALGALVGSTPPAYLLDTLTRGQHYAAVTSMNRAPYPRTVKASTAAAQLEHVLTSCDIKQLSHDVLEELRALCSASIVGNEAPVRRIIEDMRVWYPALAESNLALLGDVAESRANSAPPESTPPAPPGAPVMMISGLPPEALLQLLALRTAVRPQQQDEARRAAVEEQASVAAEWLNAQVAEGKRIAPVFSPADAVSALQRMGKPSLGDGNGTQRQLLERMAADKGQRVLVEVPEGNPLEELNTRFPHFHEVTEYLVRNLALAACGEDGRPVRIAPILLRGEPGTGKTYYAQEVARLLSLHFVERDLSITSEAFVIAGMDSAWRGSKPGVVFDALVNGKTANPLILLNEVDKCATKDSHNSPISAMYSLLEPTSANHFLDEHVPVTLDASRVIWVLTANDGPIPAPVLSRLEVFDIRKPSYEECRAIAQSVWASICATTLPRGHGFAADLGELVLDIVGQMNPRSMRKALTQAAGLAVLDGRKYLLPEDLTTSQKRYLPEDTRTTMGFIQG